MSMSFEESAEIHPIDIAENFAAFRDLDYDRINEDQIAMAIEGQWHTYPVNIAWSSLDETLRMICTIDMKASLQILPRLYELLNLINDLCWCGSFTWWDDQKLIVFRYALILTGEQTVQQEQVDTMIDTAIASCEQFYPALQLVLWGDSHPTEALKIAINKTYGTA